MRPVLPAAGAHALLPQAGGRFGRRGQCDYAAANQVLDSVALQEAVRRPGCRVVSFAWGPWDGGMVTPALKREFEREGVSLLARASGARLFVEELAADPGTRPVLQVVGSGLDEGDAAGPRPLTEAIEERIEIGLDTHPYLNDHRLDGRPVLPLAMSMELLCAAAVRHVGGVLLGLDDVRVLRGVTLDGPTSLTVHVGPTRPEGEPGDLRALVELKALGGTVHVRASVRLGRADSAARTSLPESLETPQALDPWPTSMADAYSRDLFHGPAFHCLARIDGTAPEGMAFELSPSASRAAWLPQEPEGPWITGPLAVDGVFQALILWCRRHHAGPSLPSRVASYQQYRPHPPGGLKAVVRIRRSAKRSVLSDIELRDSAGALVARLDGFACTVSPTLDKAFSRSTEAPVGPPATA